MINAVVEVAIGLIVLYSLLSLVSSKINELASTVLSLRGRNLLRAVKLLVGDDCGHQIYDHPLVRSLYDGDPPGMGKRGPREWLRRYPSYLPAEKFVMAVLKDAVPSAIKAPPPLPPDPRALVATASNLVPPPAAAARSGALAAVDWPAKITSELSALPDGTIKRSLCDIWDAASYDVVAFRAGVEDWFNHTMDRASGWYKRRTQLMVLIIGFLLALALNVDTIRITQQLWADGPLRSAVVEEVKKLPVPPTTTSTTVQPVPPAAPGSSQTTTTTTPTGQLQQQVIQIQQDLRQVDGLNLPLGWGRGLRPHGLVAVLVALVGWLLTAVALSLGAPFWFDLLAKVAALRGSGTKEPTPTQESNAARR
ncbi:MAG: hypothetical protein ABR511_05055 [Acidimicrobiales bacterium]